MEENYHQEKKTSFSIKSFVFGIATILAAFSSEEMRKIANISGGLPPSPVEICACDFSIPIEAYFYFITLSLAVLSIIFGLLALINKEQRAKKNLIFIIIAFCLSFFSIIPMAYELSETSFEDCYGITKNGQKRDKTISICPEDTQGIKDYYIKNHYDGLQ